MWVGEYLGFERIAGWRLSWVGEYRGLESIEDWREVGEKCWKSIMASMDPWREFCVLESFMGVRVSWVGECCTLVRSVG